MDYSYHIDNDSEKYKARTAYVRFNIVLHILCPSALSAINYFILLFYMSQTHKF